MATVRCPKCGTINPNGRRRLARCSRCHEALGKCRYCRYYNPQMMDCTHPSRPEELKIVDLDQVLNCVDFSSLFTTAAARSRVLSVLRTALIALVGGLIAMFGVIRIYQIATEVPPPVLLRATVSAPDECIRDAGLDIKVLVLNNADHPAEDVQVLISGLSMPHLTCQSVDPPEAFAEATRKSVSAWIGRLEPGDIGSVAFHFLPSKEGKVDLVAQVIAANMEGPQKIAIKGNVLP